SPFRGLRPARSHNGSVALARAALEPGLGDRAAEAGAAASEHVLTAEEAERVLERPNVTEPIGLRDRAILGTVHAGEDPASQGGARADAPEREDRPAEGGGRDERAGGGGRGEHPFFSRC